MNRHVIRWNWRAGSPHPGSPSPDDPSQATPHRRSITATCRRGGGAPAAANVSYGFVLRGSVFRLWNCHHEHHHGKAASFRQGLNMLMADKVGARCAPAFACGTTPRHPHRQRPTSFPARSPMCQTSRRTQTKTTIVALQPPRPQELPRFSQSEIRQQLPVACAPANRSATHCPNWAPGSNVCPCPSIRTRSTVSPSAQARPMATSVHSGATVSSTPP